MSKYTYRIKSKLPLSEEQLDGLVRIVEAMDDDETDLLFKVGNPEDIDDFMAVYVRWSERGRHVEIDYDMSGFNWKYPLVLAGNVSVREAAELLRQLLLELVESGDIGLVFNHFRATEAVRYGEPESKTLSKRRKRPEAQFEREE